jgi:hypothetical protein
MVYALSSSFSLKKRKKSSKPQGRYFWLIMGGHICVFAICVMEIFSKSFRDADGEPTPWMGVSLLWCATWLVVGPLLVRLWERKWRTFAEALDAGSKEDAGLLHELDHSLAILDRVRPLVIMVPMVLMFLAFHFGYGFFDEVLGVGREDFAIPIVSLEFSGFLWALILMVGCYSAGWGVWCGVVTLIVAIKVSQQRWDFSPFAGVTSKQTRLLSRFCFASAFIFCAGGTIVVPAFTAAASQTDGAAPWIMGALIVLVVGMAASLLAVPAVAMSRQLENERERYLDKLSAEIEVLAERLIRRSSEVGESGSVRLDESDSVRLDSLLDIRSHVMQHMNSESSIRLVRLLPLTILMPLSSALTSWIGLLKSGGKS